MQRKLGAYVVAAGVILALGVSVPHASGARTGHAHVAGRPDRVTACGVERWAVKTGMDPDERLVDLKVVVPTNIIHLRSLPAPAYLPLRSRLRPVETTVWAVDQLDSTGQVVRHWLQSHRYGVDLRADHRKQREDPHPTLTDSVRQNSLGLDS